MDFIKGMDISFLPQLLDQGAVFSDENGKVRNVFELLQENGVNSIRLRIWNEPENIPQSGGYCNLKHTIELAKKIKQYGMSFFLDFHYSDWWADPAKQEKPKAWKDLSFEELKNAVYDYTKEVLLQLNQEGVMPDMVQIGNEIRSGMLFPDGEVPNYEGLVELVNSGIRAVREVDKDNTIKVVIHLDQGGRFFYLKEWFDQALAAGMDDFDIIGVSYYPFWHGTFAEFKDTLVGLIKRYKKPIVIAETAHAWRLTKEGFIGEEQEKIAGFPATPEAQHTVIDIIMNITASLEDEMGLGIYYWEPVVIPVKGEGGWSSNMGIFDEKGHALPALRSFRFLRSDRVNKVAKIYLSDIIVMEIGSSVNLPQSIKVLFYDGSCSELSVEWEEFDRSIPGEFIVKGNIPEIGQEVQAVIVLVDCVEDNHNFIPNADFSVGMEEWSVQCSDSRVKVELHPEFIEPFPAPPEYFIYIESPINFKLELTNEVEGLASGTYCIQVEYRGTNTTGVDVTFFAETDGINHKETVIFPTDENWVTYKISDININQGRIKFGLNFVSPPVFAKIKRFSLTRINSGGL